jgi:hypothetical protein
MKENLVLAAEAMANGPLKKAAYGSEKTFSRKLPKELRKCALKTASIRSILIAWL